MKKKMIEIKNLSFSHEDQIRFAEFSGDKNPIHTNQKIAKKTIAGECVVHGVHLILISLEYYLNISKQLPTTCNVEFKNPVPVGTSIRIVIDEDKHELKLLSDISTVCCIIEIENKVKNYNTIKDTPLPKMKVLTEPKKIDMSNLKIGAIFPSTYGGAAEMGCLLFPSLCKVIGAAAVYEVAILSNFVGMQVPGLHSLFSKCSVKIREKNISVKPHFKLSTYDNRFKIAKFKYTGTHIDAEITAFERPFYAPKSFSDLKKVIPEKLKLNSLRMLIIGGSSGIGESVARVAALLGSDVSFTYNSSKEDALLITKDIKKNSSCRINTFKLDVTSQESIEALSLDYDILCYFPSGKIFEKIGNSFDIKKFDKFYQIYCVAFNRIARKFLKSGGKKIYYPSSEAVISTIRGLEEYKLAKQLGEKICKGLMAEFDAEIICERLGRIKTGQTLTIMPISSRDSVEVAIDICKKLTFINKR